MKYLRTYELFTPDGEWNHKPGTGNEIDYAIGDTVICVEGTKIPKGLNRLPRLEEGKEYKVVNLYQIPEDKYLGNKFLRVDVEDTKTGEITKGWESTRFKLDYEFAADKYNV